MPGSTPIYGIPYPCSGENIDCGIFADWAQAIQTAVDSVRTLENQALNRPSARASGTAQSGFVSGTPTNVVYQTEVYDNNAIVNLGTDNTAFTIQTPGWYLFASSAEVNPGGVATSLALALSQNGTVNYRHKTSPNPINTQAFQGLQVIGLFNCAAADVIRAVFTVTGGVVQLTRATTFGYLVSQA